MVSKIESGIIKAISFVPGLVGLSSIDFGKKATMLKEGDWTKGISFEETSKGVIVKVSAIISRDIRAKLVSKEITSSVKNVMKKNNEKLDNIIVYIRGVK